jgi:hypothetical protein
MVGATTNAAIPPPTPQALAAPTSPAVGAIYLALHGTSSSDWRFQAMTRHDYMIKAARCRKAADLVRDPAERDALLKVASCYLMLAEYVGNRDTSAAVPSSDEHTVN